MAAESKTTNPLADFTNPYIGLADLEWDDTRLHKYLGRIGSGFLAHVKGTKENNIITPLKHNMTHATLGRNPDVVVSALESKDVETLTDALSVWIRTQAWDDSHPIHLFCTCPPGPLLKAACDVLARLSLPAPIIWVYSGEYNLGHGDDDKGLFFDPTLGATLADPNLRASQIVDISRYAVLAQVPELRNQLVASVDLVDFEARRLHDPAHDAACRAFCTKFNLALLEPRKYFYKLKTDEDKKAFPDYESKVNALYPLYQAAVAGGAADLKAYSDACDALNGSISGMQLSGWFKSKSEWYKAVEKALDRKRGIKVKKSRIMSSLDVEAPSADVWIGVLVHLLRVAPQCVSVRHGQWSYGKYAKFTEGDGRGLELRIVLPDGMPEAALRAHIKSVFNA